MMHRLETTLKILTSLFVITGAILWLLPSRVPAASALPLAVTQPTTPSVSTPSSDSASVSAVIASNIFSPSRVPPRSRYSPATGSGEEPAGAGGVPSASLLTPPPLRVFGTMTGPGGATALMVTDSAGASGRLYREGDRIGGYRVVRITGSSVVVSGPAGRVELKIQPREDRTQ